MIQFLSQNKEVVAISVSLFGILLSLCFGGIMNWRQKICFDYQSRMAVAINILSDEFVQRTSAHYSDVAHERRRKRTDLRDIYGRPEQQKLFRDLGKTLEDSNRVRRYFRWLDRAAYIAVVSVWLSIVLSAFAVLKVWIAVPSWLAIVWAVFLVGSLASFGGAVSVMFYFDGRFFQLTNKIIKPEEE